MPFQCSICDEPSTRICVRCTKDACENHLCEKCLKCSDCCECEVALDATRRIAAVVHTPPAPDPATADGFAVEVEPAVEVAAAGEAGTEPEPVPEPAIAGDPTPDPAPSAEPAATSAPATADSIAAPATESE